MRDVEGRDSETPLNAKDLAPHLHAQVRVEVRERLVHKEHGGLADECPAHGDPLALPTRELPGLAQDDFREPEHVDRLACLPLALVLRNAAHPEGEGDVLEHVQVRVEGVVLEDHRHVPVAGRDVVDDLVVEADRSRRDLLQAGDHPQHGRLAAARRSDEDDELSLVDEQVEPADSLDAVRKDLRQLLEGQRRQAAPCQSNLGSQTRIPPSPRFAHAK